MCFVFDVKMNTLFFSHKFSGIFIYVSLGVKPREIINPLFEAFGTFLLPVLERLSRREVSERLLWDLVIV